MSGADAVTAGEASWDRTETRLFAALALGMLASLAWLVAPFYEVSDETNDASMYLLSARALLAGEGYAYLGTPFIARPPGMSVMLAPILGMRGLDFTAMNALVSLWGLAGALLFFVWTRPRVGPWVAAALATCLWLNPGYRHFSNQVMSDVPGVALLLLGLVLERWAARRPSWRRDALLGALIGLSTYVRSIGILLVPAILAARALENLRASELRLTPGRFLGSRALALCAACALVVLPWSVRNALVASSAPTDQNFIYSYWTGVFRADAGDPDSPPRALSDVTGELPGRARAIATLLGARLEGRGGDAEEEEDLTPGRRRAAQRAQGSSWILGLWVIGCVAWSLVRFGRSSEILFVLVGLVLLVYFGFRVRLGLPLFVIGLAAFAEAHLALARRFLGPARAGALVAVALLALAALDFQPRKDWELLARNSRDHVDQTRAFAERLPADARLAARVGWHYALFLDRPVWSLRFAIDHTRDRDPAGMESALDKYGLDTVLIGPSRIESFLLPYLRQRYGSGERAGEGWIFRVRP